MEREGRWTWKGKGGNEEERKGWKESLREGARTKGRKGREQVEAGAEGSQGQEREGKEGS